MFTGIVEAHVPILALTPAGEGARLRLPAPDSPDWAVERGESVAVSGVCLTVADLLGPDGEPVPDHTVGAEMAFDLSRETLERTWFGQRPDGPVNLERALRLSDRLSGHLVAGHVDGVGRVVEVRDSGDGGAEIEFEVPEPFTRYLIEKGSVTIDGISLTVVEPRATRFFVAVIPVTLAMTSLGSTSAGLAVNLEADLVGKWIERLVRPVAGA